MHEGTCLRYNHCSCPSGYTGSHCQQRKYSFPAHFRHLFIQFHQFSIQFRPEKLTAFKSKVQFSSNCYSHSFFVNQILKFSIQSRQLSLKFVSVAKRVTNARIKFVILSNKFIILSFKFVKCYWAFTSGRRFWLKLWRKWMSIDEITFAV